MDRTSVSGTDDVGSIPTGDATYKAYKLRYYIDFFVLQPCLKGVKNLGKHARAGGKRPYFNTTMFVAVAETAGEKGHYQNYE